MPESTCGICARNMDRGDALGRVLWEDERWLLRHNRPPYGVAGWAVIYSKRHVAGIAHFDDVESAQFGPLLRSVESLLEEVTGALRIYTAVMAEASPHFHGHIVPRYSHTPGDVKAWQLFGLLNTARAGEVVVNEFEVDRICEAMSSELSARIPF